MAIRVLCFGPLAEQVGWRENTLMWKSEMTGRIILEMIGATEWLAAGISVAVSGQMVDIDSIIPDNCEVALLPPVSGG